MPSGVYTGVVYLGYMVGLVLVLLYLFILRIFKINLRVSIHSSEFHYGISVYTLFFLFWSHSCPSIPLPCFQLVSCCFPPSFVISPVQFSCHIHSIIFSPLPLKISSTLLILFLTHWPCKHKWKLKSRHHIGCIGLSRGVWFHNGFQFHSFSYKSYAFFLHE